MSCRMHVGSALVALGILVVGSPLTGQSSQPCRPAEARVTRLKSWVTRVATGSDSIDIANRARYHIPATTAGSIAFVTDSSTCQQAINAYATSVGDTTATRRVYLLRVDTTYVALDPETRGGEWKVAMVMSSVFAVLTRFFY
jgi:hypothetical protein